MDFYGHQVVALIHALLSVVAHNVFDGAWYCLK